MDLIKEALSMGFADAAIMDTKDLVFVPEYRQFCEDNLCGNYNLVPAARFAEGLENAVIHWQPDFAFHLPFCPVHTVRYIQSR